MFADLVFFDSDLEERFLSHLRVCRATIVQRFAAFRFWMLVGVTIRAWFNGRWVPSDWLFLVGAASNLLPVLAVSPALSPRCARAAQWGAVFTDVMQAGIGAHNHAALAPSRADLGPLAMLAYLPYGSTSLWLFFYVCFSSLPFHLELVKAALATTMLLAHGDGMCANSHGLRSGYDALHRIVHAPVRLARTHLLPGAAASATPPVLHAAGSCGLTLAAACPVSLAWRGTLLTPAEAGGAPVPAEHAVPAPAVCHLYETVALCATCIACIWYVFHTQRSMRLAFLAKCAASDAPRGSPEARLAADAEQELGCGVPDHFDFLICMALPGALCICLPFHLNMLLRA